MCHYSSNQTWRPQKGVGLFLFSYQGLRFHLDGPYRLTAMHLVTLMIATEIDGVLQTTMKNLFQLIPTDVGRFDTRHNHECGRTRSDSSK
jgi:hypothetical protein